MILGVIDTPCALNNGLENAILGSIAVHIDFLVGVLAVVVARYVACDNNHGNGVESGVGNTCQHVGQTRSQVAHNHRCLVGQTRIAVSGGRCHMYLRAGRLGSGERMAVFFNLGFDVLEDIPLACEETVTSVEYLKADGTRESAPFTVEGKTVRIQMEARTLLPVV